MYITCGAGCVCIFIHGRICVYAHRMRLHMHLIHVNIRVHHVWLLGAELYGYTCELYRIIIIQNHNYTELYRIIIIQNYNYTELYRIIRVVVGCKLYADITCGVGCRCI